LPEICFLGCLPAVALAATLPDDTLPLPPPLV
jgi:hypothetical protein